MIREKVETIVIKTFALAYKHIYIRYLIYLRPGKLEQRFGGILDTMEECNDCTDPREIPEDDSVADHTCEKHHGQIREGELGELL